MWTSDTAVVCGSRLHLGMVFGFGVPGVALFVLGLPLGLLIMLMRNNRTMLNGRCKLEDPKVRRKLLANTAKSVVLHQ